MRTGYLSAILAGLVSAATAAGQDMPPPRPWPGQEAPADIIPAAKAQLVFPPASVPLPMQLPPPTPMPPLSVPPEGPVPPGMAGQPFGMAPPELPPDGPPGPEEPEGSTIPLSRFWVTATYLHWWVRGDQSTPILTTGKNTDAIPGALRQPNTRAVFGSIDDHQSRDGIRTNFAYALEANWLTSVEGNFLYMPSRFTHFQANLNQGTSNLVIARPFVDADTLTENAFVVSSPGVVQGTVFATGVTDLWSGEVNFHVRQMHDPGFFIHFLGGLRFAQLNDALHIAEGSVAATSSANRADLLFRFDDFTSRNYFFGPQVGLELEWVRHNFTFNINGKLAAGLTQEDVSVSGGTQGEAFSGRLLAPINAGFLTAPTNIGTFAQGRFGLLGEIGVTFAYQLSPNWRLAVGYSCLYWNRVARADQQVDRTLNQTQITNTGTAGQLVGSTRPNFAFNESDFWAQGMNFTVEFRY